MPGIFICYRRSDDSRKYVRDLAEKLRDAFGPDMVFRDTGIASGEKYPKVLQKRLQWCSLMLVVIGRRWLSESGPKGQMNRLYDAGDWVRREISAGLRRKGILVIPTLVAGAALPSADQLPAPLKPLLRNQAVCLDPERHWEDDINSLIESLTTQGFKRPSAPTRARSQKGAESDIKPSHSQQDCVGRWCLKVDGDLVEILLKADGSWIATTPSQGVVQNLVKRYQGEWSLKNGFLRITQTRFGIPFVSSPLRQGSSTWVDGRIRRVTEQRIVLQNGRTLTAV
jgi:hypothetical protein